MQAREQLMRDIAQLFREEQSSDSIFLFFSFLFPRWLRVMKKLLPVCLKRIHICGNQWYWTSLEQG